MKMKMKVKLKNDRSAYDILIYKETTTGYLKMKN